MPISIMNVCHTQTTQFKFPTLDVNLFCLHVLDMASMLKFIFFESRISLEKQLNLLVVVAKTLSTSKWIKKIDPHNNFEIEIKIINIFI